MKKLTVTTLLFASLGCFAQARVMPPPMPPVVFRPTAVRTDEKPVVIETKREIVADNGLYQLVETTITFTNPNGRVFEGELEFPLPDGATVCGYALEVNGTMVPGVVCEKETARVAFENEKRQGIDPGLVENVKGNVWKTRIYPLMPNVPRKAQVTYLAESGTAQASATVVEKFGDDVFVGRRLGEDARQGQSLAERLRKATQATIYWDASMSRQGKVAADRNLLECLPEKGEWDLVVFRNVIEKPIRFTDRDSLLKAVDSLPYDGGTCWSEVEKAMRAAKGACFAFTDEKDVEAAARRCVTVEKLSAGEKPPAEPKEGRLLATAWAANRVADLAGNAEANKRELVEIGRRYGVASPVTSLIVLERLDQYLRYKIEPPKSLGFYDEWKKRRAAEDDPIAAEREKAEHRRMLLQYWEERVTWWKNPIPPKQTPSSGLFASTAAAANRAPALGEDRAVLLRSPVTMRSMYGSRRSGASEAAAAAPREERARRAVACKSSRMNGSEAAEEPAGTATVKIAAWDPKTPYLTALGGAASGTAYAEYLKQREVHGVAPAFYLDCAGWFFKAKERLLAIRVISNLSEMKLEDMGLWRTMGWRLREAGAFDEAVAAFRHVLTERGEEPQSRRDLALVLSERGKELFANGDRAGAARDVTEAMRLLHEAAFVPAARRSGRRSNDIQTSVFALEELNGLIAWTEAQDWCSAAKPSAPAMDAAFRRDLPLDLRIVLSWDTDETDVDLHVLEPDGEEAYYGHRRTSTGGFVSEDVTTGYGPEEYLRKAAPKGVYKILANYFASHRQALTGAAVVTATVYTGWGRKDERRQVLSLRLDKPKDKCPIGEITVD